MRQRFQPRHIVAIVVAVCAAAILTPVAVGAATGTLVNIADPVDTTRVAKVTFNNGLQTEARAAANPANLIRAYKTGLNTGRGVVASFPTPYVAAITHVTYANFPTSTAPAHIELVGWTRISGTGTCGHVQLRRSRAHHQRASSRPARLRDRRQLQSRDGELRRDRGGLLESALTRSTLR